MPFAFERLPRKKLAGTPAISAWTLKLKASTN